MRWIVVMSVLLLSGCATLETVKTAAGQVRDLAGQIYDGLAGSEPLPDRPNEMNPPTPANL